jgi:hypothetical protein
MTLTNTVGENVMSKTVNVKQDGKNKMDRETMIQDLETTLHDIQGQMDFITEQAEYRNQNVNAIVDADGHWVMTPLLVAKAQILAVLSAFMN